MSFTANANGPRGFSVAKGRNGTPHRSVTKRIEGDYATKIYRGQPVTQAAGFITVLGAANAEVAGVFDGVEYVAVDGSVVFSPYWPAPGAVKTGTVPKARVYDADGLFLIQTATVLTQADVGKYADLSAIVGGSDVTGQSSIALDGANIDATIQSTSVVQILEVSPREEGGEGAPGSLAIVQFVRKLFSADANSAA